MPAELTLYIRHGCHLCDAFVEEMASFDSNLLKSVCVVDVDESLSDRQEYNDKVPILFIKGTEVCRFYFDADRIKSCLKLGGDSLE